MIISDDRFSAARRLILKGAGAVALIGLGNIPFGFASAFAAANDKYPEQAFKAKSDADAIKSLYGKTAEPSDKVKLDAPEICRERHSGSDLGHYDACRRHLDFVSGLGKSERAGGVLQDSGRDP